MMAHRTATKPRLEMIVEPETKVRFRYESEGGSHGGLAGKRAGKEKSYPTVKLVGHNKKKSVYIKVSLYTEDYEPHVLEFKGCEGSVSDIKEYLTENNTAMFPNIKILNKKKENVYDLLMDQKLEKMGNLTQVARAEFKKKYSKEVKERAKDILNSVKLCFEAFEDGKQSRLCEPLFSEVICNQKTASKGELRIYRMSKVYGSCKGGEEIILLCDKVQKEKIMIKFYEIDSKNCIIWEKPGIFTTADVHYQVAITFKTPEYRENVEKKVFVRLARGVDYSEPLEFTFIPDFYEKPLKKRKLYNCEESVSISPPMLMEISNGTSNSCSGSADSVDSPETPVDEDVWADLLPEGLDVDACILSELEEVNNEFLFYNDSLLDGGHSMIFNSNVQVDGICSTILKKMTLKSEVDADASSDVCASNSIKLPSEACEKHFKAKNKVNSLLAKRDKAKNTLLHIAVYQDIKDKDITTLLKANQFADIDIINVQNVHQETALHIATKLNKDDKVAILLLKNFNPNLKDIKGNNCYHIASQNNYSGVMLSLLTHVRCTPELDAFNYAGLSPLHLAVKSRSDGCYNLLRVHSANTSTKERGRGRSLLHYAIEFWPCFVNTLLKDKETLILVNEQDFEGNTPLHLACVLENVEVVKQLLDAGADPLLKNFKRSDDEENCGETPADLSTNPKILEVLRKASSNISTLDSLVEELCKLLNVNERWKYLAVYFVDEIFINSLQLSPSPTRALLDQIKKDNAKDFIQTLKNGIEMAELWDALKIFKQRETFE